MKLNLILAVALFAATIGAAICPAQRMVGDYRETSKTDKTVVAIANFAVQAQNKAQKGNDFRLTEIERAEEQIVAGVNYRLCLSVEKSGAREQATAIVYHNLQNQYELTDWMSGDCSGGETKPELNAKNNSETETFKGSLNVGKTDSHIVYVGEESGDFAAFCFKNNSPVGKRILAACKNGERCQFVGKIDFEAVCKPKDLEDVLSASGKIVSVESVKSLDPKKKAVGGKKTATIAGATNTPHAVVKNLYAAKGTSSPFFQKKSRALVDKYFTREYADLIWQDATAPGEGVGALDFDPLYYAQDVEITDFVIEKADDNNIVKVRFKNMGKDEEIIFSLTKENTASKVWKIESMVYSDGEDLGSILSYGMMTEAERKESESANKLDGDYLVGAVKCTITTNKSGFWARVKCDDQENFQVIDTESLTFGEFNPKEKGRRGRFISREYGEIEKFVDATGKEFKVKRIK